MWKHSALKATPFLYMCNELLYVCMSMWKHSALKQRHSFTRCVWRQQQHGPRKTCFLSDSQKAVGLPIDNSVKAYNNQVLATTITDSLTENRVLITTMPLSWGRCYAFQSEDNNGQGGDLPVSYLFNGMTVPSKLLHDGSDPTGEFLVNSTFYSQDKENIQRKRKRRNAFSIHWSHGMA